MSPTYCLVDIQDNYRCSRLTSESRSIHKHKHRVYPTPMKAKKLGSDVSRHIALYCCDVPYGEILKTSLMSCIGDKRLFDLVRLVIANITGSLR